MDPAPRSRVGRRLFVAFALLYALTAHGRHYSDDVFQFEQVQVFVETGEFAMSAERDPEALGGAGAFMRPGVDGRVYLTLAPGLALAASPLGWIGHVLGVPNPAPEAPSAHAASPSTTFWASLTVPLAMAGAVWALFSLVASTSGSTRRAMQAALVFALATNTWFYATTFWTQPLAAACWIGAVALLHRDRTGAGSLAPCLAAGALVGYSVATRFELALLVPWFFVLVRPGSRARNRRLVAFALPLLAFALALLAWNDFRFGDPFQTRSLHQGTGPFRLDRWPAALPTILFGPGEGLFVYSPALVLGVLGARAAFRSHRALTIFALGSAVSMIFLYAAFAFWSTPSPMSWGNRFLYLAVPWLLLPAFVTPDHDPVRSRWARMLLVASGAVALAGILQRVRLGPPVWWIDDPVRMAVAVVLAGGLVAVAVRLRRGYVEMGPR